jgi:hypothetical protein
MTIAQIVCFRGAASRVVAVVNDDNNDDEYEDVDSPQNIQSVAEPESSTQVSSTRPANLSMIAEQSFNDIELSMCSNLGKKKCKVLMRNKKYFFIYKQILYLVFL